MYTQCPNCHTYFRIGPEHLKAAGGKVRCGQCDTVFNALDTLTDELPETLQAEPEAARDDEAPTPAPESEIAETEAAQSEADTTETSESGASETTEETADEAELITSTLDEPEGDLEEIFAEDEAEIAKEFGLESVDEAAETVQEEAPPQDSEPAGPATETTAEAEKKPAADDDDFEDWGDLDEPLPTEARSDAAESHLDESGLTTLEETDSRLDEPSSEFADSTLTTLEDDEEAPRDKRSTALWGGLIALLGLVLLGQVAYLKRDVLAQIPSLRPAVAQLCALTGCELPPLRDLAAIQIESRDVRSHPERPNALVVNATFVNTADFPQPFPVMRLRFTDIQGRVVAERQFQPREYLGPDIDIERGMPPGVPIHITLEIADPGQEAVNFEFDFT